MATARNLLGALLRRGMTYSTARRIAHSLSERGIGGPGGILEQQLDVSPTVAAEARRESTSSSAYRALACDIAPPDLQMGNQATSHATGGLGDLIDAVVRGGKSAERAIGGGGAFALLGSIALGALRGSQPMSKQAEIHPVARLAAGLSEPKGAHDEEYVEAIVDLTVKAMINAAKADGRIDEDEMQTVVDELEEDGISQAQREYLLAEARKPMSTDELVRAVPTRQVAAQVYAASLLAIEVDTPAEKAYLQRLARDLNLDDCVVKQIRATFGVASWANWGSWRMPISVRIPITGSRIAGGSRISKANRERRGSRPLVPPATNEEVDEALATAK